MLDTQLLASATALMRQAIIVWESKLEFSALGLKSRPGYILGAHYERLADNYPNPVAGAEEDSPDGMAPGD
jgi:hypothetical protein